MDNLNPESKKIFREIFDKMRFEVFLLYKAESDLKEKSVNKVLFEAPYCQNDTNMWYSNEDLRKKNAICFIKFPSFASEEQKSYFHYKISVL